jgi:small subunit ribosomal protein S17
VTDQPDITDHEQTPDAPAEQAEPEAVAPEPTSAKAPQESPAEDVPAAEPGDAPAAGEPAAEAEPAEVLSSKERRRRTRSTHTGNHKPSRTPEERHAERLQERKRKATRRRARRIQERTKAAQRRATAPASGPETSSVDGPPARAREGGAQRVRQGIVVSDKPNKTITVRIDVARRHRRYEKIVRSSSTFHVHDENNDAHEGDTVRVIESRPLSRTKRWKLVEVLERAR